MSPSLRDAREALEREALEEALALLDRAGALELPAGRPAPALDAAATLRLAGRFDQAAHALDLAEEAGMAAAALIAERARLALWQGRPDEALEQLEALDAPAAARNPVLLELRAQALLHGGQTARALQLWQSRQKESGRKLCPVSTQPEDLALTAAALEDWSDRPAPPESPEPRPGPPPGRGRAARLAAIARALEAGRPRQAALWLEALPEADRQDPEAALLRALEALEQARPREAREALAPRLGDGEPLLLALYGLALARSGEAALGLEVLERVAPAGPDDYFAHCFRAAALWRLGRRAPALLAWRHAFRHYFFDNFYYLFLPAWRRAAALWTEQPHEAGS